MKNPSRNSLSKDFVIFLTNISQVKINDAFIGKLSKILCLSTVCRKTNSMLPFLYYRMIKSFGNFVSTSTPSFVTTTSSSIRTPVTSDL